MEQRLKVSSSPHIRAPRGTRSLMLDVIIALIPSLIAAIIVFASAFGDYEIPAILGGTEHRMLSVYTYLKYADPIMRDHTEAYVLMIFMSLTLIAVILAYRKLTMAEEKRS